MTHVPFKGAGPALAAAMVNDVQVVIDPLATAKKYSEAGKLRALAVTTGRRSKLWPEMPTVAESGVKEFYTGVWYGIYVAAKTPPAVVQFLNTEFVRILKSPEMVSWLREQGLRDATPASRAGLDIADDGMSNLRKLMQGRVDMEPTSHVGLKSFCQSEGVDCSRFRRVMVLPFSVDLYLAASLKTSPAVLRALRAAYDRMQQDGSYHQLLSPYLDNSDYALATGKPK